MALNPLEQDAIAGAVGTYMDDYLLRSGKVIVAEGINHGRKAESRKIGIVGAIYDAVLDRRTCPVCKATHGLQVYVSDIYGDPTPGFEENEPPRHERCRCIWIYQGDTSGKFKPTLNPELYVNERLIPLLQKEGIDPEWYIKQSAYLNAKPMAPAELKAYTSQNVSSSVKKFGGSLEVTEEEFQKRVAWKESQALIDKDAAFHVKMVQDERDDILRKIDTIYIGNPDNYMLTMQKMTYRYLDGRGFLGKASDLDIAWVDEHENPIEWTPGKMRELTLRLSSFLISLEKDVSPLTRDIIRKFHPVFDLRMKDETIILVQKGVEREAAAGAGAPWFSQGKMVNPGVLTIAQQGMRTELRGHFGGVWSAEVIDHETGHHLWEYTSKGKTAEFGMTGLKEDFARSGWEWNGPTPAKNLRKKIYGGNFESQYAGTDIDEDFAESIASFGANPFSFIKRQPERYNAMRGIVKESLGTSGLWRMDEMAGVEVFVKKASVPIPPVVVKEIKKAAIDVVDTTYRSIDHISDQEKFLLADSWDTWRGKLNDLHRSALFDYKKHGYVNFNKLLRGMPVAPGYPHGYLEEKVARIRGAIAKGSCPENLTVYRFVRIEEFEAKIHQDGPKSLTGMKITDNGFQSTSLRDDFNPTMTKIILRIPKGTPVANMENFGPPRMKPHVSSDEMELLLQADTSWRVTDCWIENSGRIVIKADVLP